VQSETTESFRKQFAAAAPSVQLKIRAAYQLWAENPQHPSLKFKKVHASLPIFSARVDLDWRTVGVLKADTMVWFFVGPHSEYERLLKQL